VSDVVIRAERLGKKYLIGHEASNEGYVALRDVMARTAKGFVRSARDMLRGRQLVAGDELEEFWAVKDLDFEIKRGEVVGIIGRNGAGKSTLLKILSRITEPSTGRVRIKGRVASLLEVGTGFHAELTGRENIFLNGAILGMTRAEIRRRFDEIVGFAEIEKFLDTPVKRYSSGMYVRLAFAIAAHLEPEILIVDEVLAVGDAEFQKKCLGKMQDVAGRGRTVLFVSHNMAAVKALCTRGLLLAKGSIVSRGNVGTIISEYSNSSTRAYSIAFAVDPKRPSICEINVDREALVSRDFIVEIAFASPLEGSCFDRLKGSPFGARTAGSMLITSSAGALPAVCFDAKPAACRSPAANTFFLSGSAIGMRITTVSSTPLALLLGMTVPTRFSPPLRSMDI
jgi:lipopolysaccharide transport system ATP-binding protein